MNRNTLLTFLSASILALAFARAHVAPPAATGTITGKIFSPATGEFVRNAHMRVAKTGQSTVSEDEGAFRLSPVPAGRATLVVTYTGYRTVTAQLDFAARSFTMEMASRNSMG